MNIALYFGSFNPIHNGHLIIANFVTNNLKVDQTWLVVSPQNPLKPQKSLLNEYHRKHLIDISIEGEKTIRCSNIEFSLPKPSYTIDTLSYLEEKYPAHKFSIIIGSDSYQNIERWKNYELLLSKYDLYVYVRPGFPIDPGKCEKVKIINAPLLDISSTMVRKLIIEGKSIRFLVPEPVFKEITVNGYYKRSI